MGKAIAFNAKKNGSLSFINMESTINSISLIDTLYSNMLISEHDDEIWYGDPIKASKMSGKDFDKYFFNNL